MAALAVALMPASADAAIIRVTTRADTIARDGRCSLREAIIAANNHTTGPGRDCTKGIPPNVIELRAGTYRLTIPPGQAPSGRAGALLIAAPLTLVGAGSGNTTIQQTQRDRVIKSTAPGVQISGVTITGGGTYSATTLLDGAGIDNEGAGASLKLSAVVITNNHADGADGSSGAGIYNTGTLTIEGSEISYNDAAPGAGDGLYTDGGPVTIDKSTIASNFFATDGGGIYQAGGGPLTVTNSSIFDNGYQATQTGGGLSLHGQADLINDTIGGNYGGSEGGGVYAAPPSGTTVTLDHVTVSNNDLWGDTTLGAGIAAAGNVNLLDSTVSGNDANYGQHAGGPRQTGSGGGVYFSPAIANASLSIQGSTIGPANEANDGDGVYLAAAPSASNVNLARSTIAADGTGTPAGLGGGLYVGADESASLHDVTLAQNESGASAGGANVYTESGASLTWHNTLVAQPLGEGDCQYSPTTTVTSLGGDQEYGDSGNADSCGFTAASDRFSSTDLLSSQLAPLAENGGPTETMALTPGAPPVDTGSGCLPTDQRGVPRPQGPACDTGAYELDTTPLRVSIMSGPSGRTTMRTVTFTFSANQPASFQCRLDRRAFAPCSSPFTTGPLAGGEHTFTVLGTDIPGNHVAVSRSFAIVVAPTVMIVRPAAGASYKQGRVIRASFSCRAGSGTVLRSCVGSVRNGHPIDTTRRGKHTFTVTALDRDGGRTVTHVTYAVT